MRSGEEGRKTAEIFELRPDRVHEEQRRPAACLLKADAQRVRYLEQTWFDFTRAEHSISLCFEGALSSGSGVANLFGRGIQKRLSQIGVVDDAR